MDKFVTKRNDLLAEQVIKNLKSRQMEGHYVQTKEEALALALELIPEGSSISWGDRKSTRLNSSHITRSRMPSSA